MLLLHKKSDQNLVIGGVQLVSNLLWVRQVARCQVVRCNVHSKAIKARNIYVILIVLSSKLYPSLCKILPITPNTQKY